MRNVLIAGLLAALTTNALAWGVKGHRMIGSLAEQRLKSKHPDVMKGIQALLGPGVSLASIANCADSIRDYVSAKDKSKVVLPQNCMVTEQEALTLFPATRTWHFINIPMPASANPGAHPDAVLEQACEEEPPCIVRQIDHFTAQLKDKSLSTRSRAIALMFLVHLVGDVHQPLHAVTRSKDRGGNEVFIRVGDHVARLHTIWDSFFLESISDADLAALPADGYGKPKTWVWESYDAARQIVYKDVPDQASAFDNPISVPDPAYRQTAVPVIKKRLKAASVRLADLLAKTLKS